MRQVIKRTHDKRGFTLGELLIVVAIIGVLVGISVPIFTGQLSKARLAANQDNARQAKTAALTMWMTDDYDYGIDTHSDGTEYTTESVYYEYDTSTGVATNITKLTNVDAVGVADDDWTYVETDIAAWTVDTPVGTNHTLGDKVFGKWYVIIYTGSSDYTDGTIHFYGVDYSSTDD